ncbi:hypothetical protein M0802_007314 [Mischocyttarus mexicanus]|nr:hypothetical protein M0802_007314 [Mischocyttarus mexicanus]
MLERRIRNKMGSVESRRKKKEEEEEEEEEIGLVVGQEDLREGLGNSLRTGKPTNTIPVYPLCGFTRTGKREDWILSCEQIYGNGGHKAAVGFASLP